MVTDEVATLSAATPDEGEAVIEELTATGAPATKVTDPSDFVIGVVICRILDSARVDVRVQVEIPEASLLEQVP